VIRATLIRPDGTEGSRLFGSVADAREWVAYYLCHPSFAGYGSVIEADAEPCVVSDGSNWWVE